MKKEPINKFIHHYELKSSLRQKCKVTNDILITQNTINLFQSNNVDNIHYFKGIKTILQRIRKNEKVVLLNQRKIYFHTYRILSFLEQYIKILDFYNSEKYLKYSFAKYKSNSSKIRREYNKLQKDSFDTYLFTGSSRLQMKILNLFLTRQELMNLLLNQFTLFPHDHIKYDSMNEGDETLKKNIKQIFSHFSSTYISSENVILKSLAIVLYSYMTLEMNMPSSYAKKIIQELLSVLFNYEFESVSNKNIYISGRLNNLPIFKNYSNNEVYSSKLKKEFTTFMKYIQRGFSDFSMFNLNPNIIFHENLIHTYFKIYPIDFMDKID